MLLSRIRAALRDRVNLGGGILVRGRLRVNAAQGQAWVGQRSLKLGRRPLKMLEVLAGRPGEVVSRAELLERVWETRYVGFEHSIEQAAYEVRKAIKEPGWIETVRGIGYRFVTQA